jgi:hypothetical protein
MQDDAISEHRTYLFHRLCEVAEKLWVMVEEPPYSGLTDEQRAVVRLFGMLIDQCSVGVRDFEHHHRGHCSRRIGLQAMRHMVKSHWKGHWRELVQEHAAISARQRTATRKPA